MANIVGWEESLNEAQRYVPQAARGEQEDFAVRQMRMRLRLRLLLDFYAAFPCLMARTHLLAACAITLGRFCGYSASFDHIGEALCPLFPDGAVRTTQWEDYRIACREGRPREIREELWLAAHITDLETVRSEGALAAFYAEAALYPGDPTWQGLRVHLEVTLEERPLDAAALAGQVPYETAMAQTMLSSVRRLLTAGGKLLGRYARETGRALLRPERESPGMLISYRTCACELLRYTVLALTAARVYRQGVRQRRRGSLANTQEWPFLSQVLAERVIQVHPAIDRFYRNPSQYQVSANLQLHTWPGRILTRLVTVVTGQGLYESHQSHIAGRFRVFRRPDGTMRFLREHYCGPRLRIFDADFAVLRLRGQPTLCEIFSQFRTIIAFTVTPLPDRGLSIRSCNVYIVGLRLPTFGLKAEFQSHVVTTEDGEDELQFDGFLRIQPETQWGKHLAYRILRRPETLGCLQYRVRPLLTKRFPTKQ